MVLKWTLSKTHRLGLAYSKIDPSLLQPQSASQEKHGTRHGRLHIFPASLYCMGILGPGGQEALYETCAACALLTLICLLHLKSLRD